MSRNPRSWPDSAFFDLSLPDELFAALERVLDRFVGREAKVIEDVLFLVLGIVHLREWIAPDFPGKPPREPANEAERFSAALYAVPEFRTLLNLANHAKHQARRSPQLQRVDYSGLPIDDWPDFDAVMSIDDGPATGYHVDNQDIAELFGTVLDFYRARWFSLPLEQRLS